MNSSYAALYSVEKVILRLSVHCKVNTSCVCPARLVRLMIDNTFDKFPLPFISQIQPLQ